MTSLAYLFIIVMGFVILYIEVMSIRRIKKLKSQISSEAPTSKIYTKFTLKEQAEKVLETTDVFLTNLIKFDKNIALKMIIFFIVFIGLLTFNSIFNLQIKQSNLGILGIFLLLVIILGPGFLKGIIIDSRIKKINQDIPIFVDMLAICIQSGMNIQQAIKFLGENISNINKGFAPFLTRMLLKSEISGIEVAIDDLQKELPSKQIDMMCTTLRQSLKYGSSVYDSLMALSQEIREHELLRTEEIIGKLSAKMSIPLILFFMFPIIIIIAAPGVMKILGEF